MNHNQTTWPEFNLKSLIPLFAMVLSFTTYSLVGGEANHCGKGQIRLMGAGTCNSMDSIPLQEINYSRTIMKVAYQDPSVTTQSPALNPNFI